MTHRIKTLSFGAGVLVLATAHPETSAAPEATNQVGERARV
jgi:hypothetical protein